MVTSIGGVLTSSGGVLTSSGDGGMVTASGGMVGKGILAVTSTGAVKVTSSIKVEVTSSTSGGMVTSTGGLVTFSRAGCSRGVMATGSGMANTSGGVVESLGGAMASDFPSGVMLKVAFTDFYNLNKVKIGAELGLKGESLKNELIRIWMNMEKSEKTKYYTNCIPEVKKENQRQKSFVTPNVQPAKDKHPVRESLKALKMSSPNDHKGSNDLTKNEILEELRFYKNLDRVATPSGTKQRTSKIVLPIIEPNAQPETFQSATGLDTTDEYNSGHPSPLDLVPQVEKSHSKPDTRGSPNKDRKELDTTDNSVAKQHEHKQETSDSEKKTFQCDVCKKGFSYLVHCNAHKMKGSCGITPMCPRCGIKFKTVKILKKHINTVHEKPLFKCGFCSKIFPTEKTTEKHIKSNHEEKNCKFCNKMFKNSNTLRSHIYEHHSKPEIDIAKDNIQPVIDETKTKGTPSSSNIFLKECSICNKIFKSKGGFNKHKNTHMKVNSTSERITVDASQSVTVDASQSITVDPSKSIPIDPSESIPIDPSESITIDPSNSFIVDPSALMNDIPFGTFDLIQDESTGGMNLV